MLERCEASYSLLAGGAPILVDLRNKYKVLFVESARERLLEVIDLGTIGVMPARVQSRIVSLL
jgi:hypothetical protein